jgi:flagellar FliL protein
MAKEEKNTKTESEAPKKGEILKSLLIGMVLALVLGGGAAFVVMSGMVNVPFLGDDKAEKDTEKNNENKAEKREDPVFVAFESLDLTIGGALAPRQLRITLAIETSQENAKRIEEMKPRILDALNTLLRAVDESDLSEPYAMDRLRSHMARRVSLAVGPDAVHDVLIMQYVIL